MVLDGVLADRLVLPPGGRPSPAGDLRQVDHHAPLQGLLVQVILLALHRLLVREGNVVQLDQLLEVRVSVGTVGEVGFLDTNCKSHSLVN